MNEPAANSTDAVVHKYSSVTLRKEAMANINLHLIFSDIIYKFTLTLMKPTACQHICSVDYNIYDGYYI